MGEESACKAGDLGSIPGLGRSPGGGHGNPLQCSCLETPQGQRILAGYSPWGHKELDVTEHLSRALCVKWGGNKLGGKGHGEISPETSGMKAATLVFRVLGNN